MGPRLQLKLKAVTLVLSQAGVDNVGIAALVTDFLVLDIPLSKAIEWSHPGSLALLDFVWMRSPRDPENTRWTVAKLLHSDKYRYYYKWEFSRALVQAIRRADLRMVQWILNHFSGCPVEKEVVEEAARGGHLWALQLLEADTSHAGIEWGDGCLEEAAKTRHWDVVRWLHKRTGVRRSSPYQGGVAELAFKQHNLEQLKWAMASGFELHDARVKDCDVAERDACWDVVRYLLAQDHRDFPYLVDGALKVAAELGDVEFSQWLLTNYGTGDSNKHSAYGKRLFPTLAAAGKFGHVEVLECLLTHLKTLDLPHDPSDAMYEAAKYGKMNVVKWLVDRYSHDSDVDLFKGWSFRNYATRTMSPKTVMDVAAAHGHLEILKFLHEVDAAQRKKRKREERDMYPNPEYCRRCTTKAMDLAASNGHLDVVKWLHANRNEGCSVFAMGSAAANGHLEVVQWLHANRSEGCWPNVLDRVACHEYRVSSCCGKRSYPRQYNSLVRNQLEIIKWLHEHRAGGCTTVAMDRAAANGNFELIKWLHENTAAGCTHRAMDNAAGLGRLDIVQWLHENRTEGCTSAAMDNAAERGHLEVLKWLHTHRSEGFTSSALDRAVSRCDLTPMKTDGCSYLRVVQWLFQCGGDFDITSAMERAIVRNELEIVCYLDAQRNESVEEMQARLRNQTVNSLR